MNIKPLSILGRSILLLPGLLWPGLLWPGAAFADDGVQAKITNDGTDDIRVTVYDASTVPRRVILSNQRINGFTSVLVSVPGDTSAKAHLSWTAATIDKAFQQCGHGDSVVGDSDSVKVHADSDCSA